MRKSKEWHAGLSTRVVNVILRLECESREDVIECIKSGRLTPDNHVDNYGAKSHAELCRWLRIPYIKRPKGTDELIATYASTIRLRGYIIVDIFDEFVRGE